LSRDLFCFATDHTRFSRWWLERAFRLFCRLGLWRVDNEIKTDIAPCTAQRFGYCDVYLDGGYIVDFIARFRGCAFEIRAGCNGRRETNYLERISGNAHGSQFMGDLVPALSAGDACF